MSSSESLRCFGVVGLPVWYVGHTETGQIKLARYRRELEHLNARQLAKRYQRYLRWADQLVAMFDVHNDWPTRGMIAQATRRLHAAHTLLKERGLHVPEREEAEGGFRRAEIYVQNQDLYERLPSMSTGALVELHTTLEAELAENRGDAALSQRYSLVWGEIKSRDRRRAAVHGGQLMEVSPAIARVLRERITQQMTAHLGYSWTHTEAALTLEAVGISVHAATPEASERELPF